MSDQYVAQAVPDAMTIAWSREPPSYLLTGIGTPLGNRATGPLVDYLDSVVL